jgi:ribose 5-phosphate isomerase B
MTRVFQIITEADARQIERGATVELAKGGHVTPLAADTLRERRVTVVPAGSVDPAIPPDLAPRSEIRRVAIASDHTGGALRKAIIHHLRGQAVEMNDLGVDGVSSVDYPDTAASVARAVARGEADAGIAIDGAGIGSAIAANKVRGIRAVMATDETIARYSRQHNGANVLTLGSSLLQVDTALRIIDTWLSTPMTEARYIRRLVKVRRLEDSF